MQILQPGKTGITFLIDIIVKITKCMGQIKLPLDFFMFLIDSLKYK